VKHELMVKVEPLGPAKRAPSVNDNSGGWHPVRDKPEFEVNAAGQLRTKARPEHSAGGCAPSGDSESVTAVNYWESRGRLESEQVATGGIGDGALSVTGNLTIRQPRPPESTVAQALSPQEYVKSYREILEEAAAARTDPSLDLYWGSSVAGREQVEQDSRAQEAMWRLLDETSCRLPPTLEAPLGTRGVPLTGKLCEDSPFPYNRSFQQAMRDEEMAAREKQKAFEHDRARARMSEDIHAQMWFTSLLAPPVSGKALSPRS